MDAAALGNSDDATRLCDGKIARGFEHDGVLFRHAPENKLMVVSVSTDFHGDSARGFRHLTGMNTPPTDQLGARIRKARKAKGLTQADLARHFDIEPQAVNKWELGRSTPKRERVWELASLLGVTAEWLMTGRDSAPSEDLKDLAVKAADLAISLSGAQVSASRRHEIIAKVLADLADLQGGNHHPRKDGSGPVQPPAKKARAAAD